MILNTLKNKGTLLFCKQILEYWIRILHNGISRLVFHAMKDKYPTSYWYFYIYIDSITVPTGIALPFG
jgi:hypothetical protein